MIEVGTSSRDIRLAQTIDLPDDLPVDLPDDLPDDLPVDLPVDLRLPGLVAATGPAAALAGESASRFVQGHAG